MGEASGMGCSGDERGVAAREHGAGVAGGAALHGVTAAATGVKDVEQLRALQWQQL